MNSEFLTVLNRNSMCNINLSQSVSYSIVKCSSKHEIMQRNWAKCVCASKWQHDSRVCNMPAIAHTHTHIATIINAAIFATILSVCFFLFWFRRIRVFVACVNVPWQNSNGQTNIWPVGRHRQRRVSQMSRSPAKNVCVGNHKILPAKNERKTKAK